MQTYLYKARKINGEEVAGSLTVESEQAALARLDQMGLFPINLEEEVAEDSSSFVIGRFRRIKIGERAAFLRQLSELLGAGVPIVRALSTLARETSNKRLVQIIKRLEYEVAGGAPLAQALERYPAVFPQLEVSLVRSAEAGGFLEDVLERIATFDEKETHLRSRVKAALAYPLLLVFVGGASLIILLTCFVPRLRGLLEDLGGSLPWPTRFMLGIQALVSKYWLLLVLVGVLLGLILRRILSTDWGRLMVDRLKLAIPVLKNVSQRLIVARFTHTLGTLLKSGIPLLDALHISKDAGGSSIFSQEVVSAGERVREGESLAAGLTGSRILSPSVKNMIAVGEETGGLADVLLRVAGNYEIQVERSLGVLVSLFEPIVILVMASIIGFVVISMLLPVFTMSALIR